MLPAAPLQPDAPPQMVEAERLRCVARSFFVLTSPQIIQSLLALCWSYVLLSVKKKKQQQKTEKSSADQIEAGKMKE